MKKYFIFSLLFTIASVVHAQYNGQIPGLDNYSNIGANRNLVRTYNPQQSGTDAGRFNLSNSTGGNSIIATSYFDGLGRPVQEIQHAASQVNGTYAQLVTVHNYDKNGREAINCLPYFSNITDLTINPLNLINNVYGQLHPDDHPYSQTIYDGSPLNRIAEQQAPGAWWVGAGRGVKMDYSANTQSDNVLKWDAAAILQPAASFNSNELFVTTNTDEDGKQVRTFIDRAGRMICKRSALIPNPQAIYQPAEWAQTYYIYNLQGNLCYVLSPEAVKTNAPALTQNVLNGLCYSYSYDERGRMIVKTLPGKLSEYYVYDNRNRLVFYRDGKLKTDLKWQFTIYDGLDRPLATGLFSTSYSQSLLADAMKSTTPYTAYNTSQIYFYLKNTDIQRNPLVTASSITGCQLLTLSCYDDYNYSGYGVNSGYIPDLDNRLQAASSYVPARLLAAMPHGSQTFSAARIQLPDGTFGNWLSSVNLYDTRSNLIQQKQQNIKGFTDFTTLQYDFNNRVILKSAKYTHSSSAPADQQSLVVSELFTYRPQNGLLVFSTHQLNNGPAMAMRYTQYDELGRVKSAYLGYDAFRGGGFCQVYSYNIRNWLTGINADYIPTWLPAGNYGPFFSEKLEYEPAPGSLSAGFYNGNISAMIWKMSGPNPQAYVYKYDGLNRLTDAAYRYSRRINGAPTMMSGDPDRGDYSVSNITYDYNGNLLSMDQKGPVQQNAHPFGYIDRMEYTYKPNSNQLDRVEDRTSFISRNDVPDFRNNNANSSDYEWDENGNMRLDRNKAITTPITYTYSNRPLTVAANGGQVQYTYDAAGNKLQKVVTSAAGTDTWDYIGPCIYKNGNLEMVMHPEGRIRPDVAAGSSPTAYIYDYFMKDHLGNVRSVVRSYAHNKLDDLDLALKIMPGGSGPYIPPPPPSGGLPDPGATPATIIPGTDPIVYTATMEVASAHTEGLIWDHMDDVRDDKPGSTDPGDLKDAMLDGNDPARRIGTAIMLRVMPGDKFSLSAQGFYDVEGSAEQNPDVTGSVLADALLSALSGGTISGSTPVSEVPENMEILQRAFKGESFGQALDALQGNGQDPEKPLAHLNYIVMDDDMNVIKEESGVMQIKGAGQWEPMVKDGLITIGRPGYLTVFTSSKSFKKVRFDIVNLTEYRGNTIEENFYYPFGLTLSTNSASPSEKNNIKFGTKELQSDLGMNWYEFGPRPYDMQTGKWLSPDMNAENYYHASPYAYANNNPVLFNDPTGKDGKVSVTGNNITISTTIYVMGNEAARHVQELNQYVKDNPQLYKGTYADPNNGGKKYDMQVNINYEEAPAEMQKNKQPGEGNNIMQFADLGFDARTGVERPSVTNIGPKATYDNNGVKNGVTEESYTGNYTKMNSSGEWMSSSQTGSHESFHLLGLGDWYDRITGLAYPGFANDKMGNSNANQLNQVHWNDWAKFILNQASTNFILNQIVDEKK